MADAVRNNWWCWVLVLGLAGGGGCTSLEPHALSVPEVETCPEQEVPNELCKVSLPRYRIAPPDILLIEMVKVVPKAPYEIEPQDQLLIDVADELPDQPIQGIYVVEANGTIALGPAYGSVPVVGLTLDAAREAITEQLKATLRAPKVSLSLAEPAARQQIVGEHLIGPDGRVNLGTYGSVYLAGMSVREAKAAIEDHLSEYLEEPEVSVEVYAYNSQSYYIVLQGVGNGQGDGVVRVPVTGNETVLDALTQIQGLQPFSSKRVWIARPAPDRLGSDQILPVDWNSISQGGATATNYQILPGDRLFVAENQMLAFGAFIDRAVQPFERVLGFSLLGVQTFQTANRLPSGFRGVSGGNPFGLGFF